jgi:DNA-binding SARP family transcriptional activator/Flp pilus assembly protein TadD
MTTLVLRLLGPFGVDGLPRAQQPRLGAKAIALLGWAALSGHEGAPRRRAAEVLWGSRAGGDPGGALRQCIHQLRRALPAPIATSFSVDADRVAIDAAQLGVDLWEFQRIAHVDDRQSMFEAAALYRGDLLEGLSPVDDMFDRILDLERVRLRGTAARLLERLCDAATTPAEVETATALGNRLIGIDPLREECYRALMRLHARLGRGNDAQKIYSACSRTLAAELGAQPSLETTRLRAAICSGGIAAPPAPAARDLAADHLMRASQLLMHFAPEQHRAARVEYEAAIALDPGSARALTGAGWTHFFDWIGEWSVDPQASGALAHAYAERALRADATEPLAWCLKGKVLLWNRCHDEAIGRLRRAVALDPTNAWSHFHLGDALTMAGERREALPLLHRASQLWPTDAGTFVTVEAFALSLLGDLELALRRADSAVARNPQYAWAYGVRAGILVQMGRIDEAVQSASQMLKLNPAMRQRYYRERVPLREPADTARGLAMLAAVGVPE